MPSKSEIDNLSNQATWIRQSIENDRTEIPESEFKRLFIPLLTGQIPEEQLMDIGFRPWIAVAGTATRWVNIINAQGEVIYSVPPLLNTVGMTNTDRSIEQDIGSRLEKTLRDVARMPRNGHQRIAQTLINSISDSQRNDKHRAAWFTVLKENGIEVPEQPGAVSKDADTDGSLFGEDYDDL